MRYRLYLDDIRYPPDNHPDWRIARNYHDALWYVKTYGLPYHVSFDHDLADVHYADENYSSRELFLGDDGKFSAPYEFTGYDFAKWLCQWIMDNDPDMTDFTFNVHSANPVGADNIRNYMANFLHKWRTGSYL